MKAVEEQTFEWLNYFQPTATDHFGGLAQPDPLKAPDRPEVYDLLLQLRRYQTNWSVGGYEDQPMLLYMELDAAHNAEDRHQGLILLNERRKQASKPHG